MSKFTDDVYAALGVVNAWNLGERYQCPVIYFNTQDRHAFGHRDHRAQVVFYRNGERRKSQAIRTPNRTSRLVESRQAHLQAAIEWAARRRLGVEEWTPSGFPNTWVPKSVKDQMTAELKRWRKQQSGRQGGASR